MHDIGGKREFFAPIDHAASEPVFHEPWEGRVFGVATFLQTLYGPNFDAFRAVMEGLPREDYFGPYYGRWLGVLERTLGRHLSGQRSVPKVKVAVTAMVLNRIALRPKVPRLLATHVMPRVVGNAKRSRRPARFAVGDAVRVRAERADGHTRQPGYVTGRRGTVVAHHGAAVFADEHAATGAEVAEHLYVVGFDGAELWGQQAEPNTELRIELFEPYLEPA
jgi:nitrile hydratase beta subunit